MAYEEGVDREEIVTLVATDTLTPYRKGEVFSLPKSQAEMVLTRNTANTDFGPRYEKVKARLFRPGDDDELLLDNHVLNAVEHKKLDARLHPDRYQNKDKDVSIKK